MYDACECDEWCDGKISWLIASELRLSCMSWAAIICQIQMRWYFFYPFFRSSYLHKDSYLAQRKERTLGYEGRYRRTLSPSGMGSNNNNSHKSENGGGVVVGIPPQHPIAPRSMQHMATSTSTTTTSSGKLDTSLTPSGKGRLLIFYSAKRLPHPLPRKAGWSRPSIPLCKVY